MEINGEQVNEIVNYAELGLSPAVCLVVEDAHAGVEAAVAGGFECAAIGDAKDDPRATHHLSTFSDLLQATK